ncbi:MAG: hypothetical protein ACKO56_07945, partial [Paracoccaceae bacterium]
MIVYPEEFNAKKAAVFRALAEVEGGAHRLWVEPLLPFAWPETRARVDGRPSGSIGGGRTTSRRAAADQ